VTTRRYRLGRRADAAAATRRRIVEATLELHDEQGISATSVRDVASRASVAPSTVLQHFPVMDALIEACGELSDQLAPMPTDAILVGATTERERIGRMASAVFEWWGQLGPGFDHLRTDRRRIPAVDDWMTDVARRHRQLADAALDGTDAGRTDLLVALTTPDAWSALRDAGLDPRRAGIRVARLIGRDRDLTEDLH
jgi:AcrR family transcriptional regulator